jgi:hypothetical protein
MYQGRLRSHKRVLVVVDSPRKRQRKLHADDDREKAGVKISRWLAQRLQLMARNRVDPITLEPPEPPVFKHVSEERFVTAFDATNLAEYFRATGNFTHPASRVPFNNIELRRLDKLLKDSNLTAQRQELEERRGRSNAQWMEVRRLEVTLQITLEDMLTAARTRTSARVALSHIILVHFPAYHAIIMQLLALQQPVEALLQIVTSQSQTVIDAVERCHLELIAVILAELEAVAETLRAIPRPSIPV